MICVNCGGEIALFKDNQVRHVGTLFGEPFYSMVYKAKKRMTICRNPQIKKEELKKDG